MQSGDDFQERHTMTDFFRFAKQIVKRPMQTMALAPSSSKLCARMAEQVRLGQGPVIELGGGTGNITKALLAHGVPADQLHVIELNPEFYELLRERHPDVNVHLTGAQNVAEIGVPEASFVVSGLPLLGFPEQLQRDIATGVFQVLRPGGQFVQFTYGPKPPLRKVIRNELGLTHSSAGRVYWNLPPATVYRFSRVADA